MDDLREVLGYDESGCSSFISSVFDVLELICMILLRKEEFLNINQQSRKKSVMRLTTMKMAITTKVAVAEA